MNRTGIRCNCGHRILRKEVLQTGLYLGVLGPNFVYVRYRCGRCKRVGEKLIQEDAWDPAVLRPSPKRSSEIDLRRYQRMGDITPDEVIDFHYSLRKLTADPEEEAQQV